MVWVAAAGPGMNIALAVLAALLFHLVNYLPSNAGRWVAENLKNALLINVFLAIFNLLPLPRLMAVVSRWAYVQIDWQYRSLAWSYTDWRSS